MFMVNGKNPSPPKLAHLRRTDCFRLHEAIKSIYSVLSELDFARSNLFALAQGFYSQNASLVTEMNL